MIDNEQQTLAAKPKEMENQQLAYLVSLIANRLFNNYRVFIRNIDDINMFLIRLIGIVKSINSDASIIIAENFSLLVNSLFATIYNLVEIKLQSNESKYLDVCLLNDLAECLLEFIGRMNRMNTVK